LEEPSKYALELRRQHLKHLIAKYQDKGDDHRAAILLRILHREACKKRWRQVNYSTKNPRGRNILSVKVPIHGGDGDEYEEFHTKGEIFEQVSKNLSERFRLAFTAKCQEEKRFDDIGFLGDTDCARQILKGAYTFPSDTDPATHLLLEEAAITFAKLSHEEVST